MAMTVKAPMVEIGWLADFETLCRTPERPVCQSTENLHEGRSNLTFPAANSRLTASGSGPGSAQQGLCHSSFQH